VGQSNKYGATYLRKRIGTKTRNKITKEPLLMREGKKGCRGGERSSNEEEQHEDRPLYKQPAEKVLRGEDVDFKDSQKN